MRKRLWIPESLSVTRDPVIDLPPVSIGGWFYVDLIDAETQEVKQHLEFQNIITDLGLNAIGTGSSLDRCIATLVVGTGSTTPAVTDTQLAGQVAATSFDGGVTDVDTTQTSPVEYASRKRTRIFLSTEAVASLTELGFKSGSTLINRSLFKDATGNPTTLTKTNRDLLRVAYEYRIFAPLNDVTGSAHFGPSACGSVDYTIRANNVNQSLGWVAQLTDMGSSSAADANVHQDAVLGSRTANNDPSPRSGESSSSFAPYTGSNFYRDVTYQWDPTAGNFAGSTTPGNSFIAGIRMVTWNPWFTSGKRHLWQMVLSQTQSSVDGDRVIEKQANNKLRITFRQRWTRV